MSASASSSPLEDFFYSRRLLLHPLPLYSSQPSSTALSPSISSQNTNSDTYRADNSFDTNVVMVLAVLLCALICSLGLNSIIRCVLRFSDIISSNGGRDSRRDTSGVSSSNTGIKKKALKTFPTVGYSADLKLTGLDTDCAICLSEFVTGERVRLLPKCNHGFHAKCIDKWLSSHSSCPKCRQCLIQTCQKIVGCSQSQATGGSMVGQAMQENVSVSIVPLEPEGLVRVYRES